MKKTILFAALLAGTIAFDKAAGQISVNVRANIGVQPIWGPVGYDYVEYYYMPDIDVFYNVPRRQYVYLQGGRWRFTSLLPNRYHDYDIYSGYKVVVNESRPYRHASSYRSKYASYKGHRDQQIIRNSHDAKYFEIKDHPEHDKWNNGQNRGKNDKKHGRKGQGHGN